MHRCSDIPPVLQKTFFFSVVYCFFKSATQVILGGKTQLEERGGVTEPVSLAQNGILVFVQRREAACQMPPPFSYLADYPHNTERTAKMQYMFFLQQFLCQFAILDIRIAVAVADYIAFALCLRLLEQEKCSPCHISGMDECQ